MLIKRKDAEKILKAAQGSLKDKSFSIQTSYKIMKLIKAIEEEDQIMNKTIMNVINEYVERDENGNALINEEGGYQVSSDKIEEVQIKLNEIQNAALQIPDIYFSLDEFEGKEMTLEEIEGFYSLIK